MPFSRRGQEIQQKAMRRGLDRYNGQAPSLTRLAAHGISQRDIGDLTSLPASGDDGTTLMTPEGNPIFLLGYSALDGGDVVG